MIFARLLTVFALAGATARAANAPLPADHARRMARGLESFQVEVGALLKEHCLKCHGGEKTKGDFDLSTREDLLKGGKEGPALVLFNAKESSMLKLMRHEAEPHMPDKTPGLPDAVIAKIADWIDHGAPYSEPLIAGRKPKRDASVVTADDRKWWAFQPLVKSEPPKDGSNPIDGFLSEKAKSKGMTFAPSADKRALIRRACFDLTGLPPTPEEVDDFVKDPLETAWPALIDRLLESPRYGERWGRHWLDVARFAESTGFEQDYDRPFAFYYRDFVIKALNMDMPYDQFVRWQLAGDEYEPQNPLALSATGFLGAGVFPSQITANEVERTRYDAMDDMLSTTGGAMLGLTIGCARCHDHKYDPIPTRDYYRMLSTFTATTRSNIGLDEGGAWQPVVTTMDKKKDAERDKKPPLKNQMMICGEGYAPIVMHSQGPPILEETHFLKRGNTELKDGVAPAGFMQVLMRQPDEARWRWEAPKDAKFSGKRRSLSNWITDVDNGAGALLARVMVNRLWQHHFGRGIVSTPNDFGKQGALPGHPELLDWLARELVRGGWKLKPLHKLIMQSTAYRQGSARDARKEAADPENDLFMRRIPQRLEGESIRDSMLAVSGGLDETMFGAGTRDEMSKRRSIYFNIKRSQLIGSMVVFDAPEPLVSQGSRPTTTVAPQALMIMNGAQVRSWAEALAKRIQAEVGVSGDSISRAYARCFGRAPTGEEARTAAAFLAQQGASYANDNRPDAPMLAFADFCQVLFGLNEFVYQP